MNRFTPASGHDTLKDIVRRHHRRRDIGHLGRSGIMSTEGADKQQQKVREFMSLLPLTLEIAGLPKGELGKQFNEGQLEVRGHVIRQAYKVARQIIVDVAK
jgi:hypothetical protein